MSAEETEPVFAAGEEAPAEAEVVEETSAKRKLG
jgi:hypothetical protein